jgi:GNAT superfamily N-acetyltransferase
MLLVSVRRATLADLPTVTDILSEAASWLEQQHMTLWEKHEVNPQALRKDVESGLFHIAFHKGTSAGVVKFQTEDVLFWPDIPHNDSAFIHRLAVRRSFAGGSISTALLKWAVEQGRKLDKRYLRLDCAIDRSRLRLIYEKFGFRHHSDKQVGSYLVARYEYKLFRGVR